MINYNLVLYIGLALIVGGFCLFLYSQMRLRQLDIEQWKLTQSFNKEQKEQIAYWTNLNDINKKRNKRNDSR